MNIDQEKIEKAIIEQAVYELVGKDELFDRVRNGINSRIDALFSEKVDTLVSETISNIANEGFDRTYQKVDAFGKPQGGKTTIRQELEKLVTAYWEARVDHRGRSTENSYNSTTRAEWMMAQICADDFSKEMKQHVVNVGGALKDHFRAVLNEHIGIMLSDVFKVNSAGDRSLKNKGGSATIHPEVKPA